MSNGELTRGQYDTLMSLTMPNDCQTDRIKALRLALESARKLVNGRFLVQMADEQMIDTASFVLRTAALKGGKFLRYSRAFDWTFRRGRNERQLLLEAMEGGAAIREVSSYAPATYRPRGEGDHRPWVVHDTGLDQEFRLDDRDVHPVWTD